MPHQRNFNIEPLTNDISRRLPLTLEKAKGVCPIGGRMRFAWYLRPERKGAACAGIECEKGKFFQVVSVVEEEREEANTIAADTYRKRFH